MQIWRSLHEKKMKKLGVANLYDPRDNVLVGIDIWQKNWKNTKTQKKP